MDTGQFEGRCVMVKRSRFPGRSGMAGAAALTQSPVVAVFGLMTGITIGGRTFEDIVDMAAGAGCADVRTSQPEGRCIVVKRSRFPGRSGVAGAAALAQRPIVAIFGLVTGITIGGRTFKDIVNMTSGAGRADVCTGQLEGRGIMVK